MRYAAMFARIEGAARQGGLRALLRIGESADIDEALAAAATPAMVDDVRALAERFAGRHADTVSGFVRAQVGACPSAGTEIGGADADIVVDGVLWDFKVTIKPQLRTEHLGQAVGYWLLDTGDDRDPERRDRPYATGAYGAVRPYRGPPGARRPRPSRGRGDVPAGAARDGRARGRLQLLMFLPSETCCRQRALFVNRPQDLRDQDILTLRLQTKFLRTFFMELTRAIG